MKRRTMNREIRVVDLLRWRYSEALAEAPPAPRAARLLGLSRPWWETSADRFRSLTGRLGKIQAALGLAMADPRIPRTGHPVPTLIVRAEEGVETSVRVLYFNVRDGRLRMRFRPDSLPREPEPTYEVTFVSDPDGKPLFIAPAALSLDGEYRVDVDLPEDLASEWSRLKVTDRMPFRLILRPPGATI